MYLEEKEDEEVRKVKGEEEARRQTRKKDTIEKAKEKVR